MQGGPLATGLFSQNVGGAMSTKTEPAYRPPFPTPAQAKSLATGIEAAISPTTTTSLAEFAVANASGDVGSIEAAVEAVIGKFDFTTTVPRRTTRGQRGML
jgi:hypothetical protein